MSDLETSLPPIPTATGMTQMQRVTSIFNAPSKTFEDIKRGNRSWWLPVLVMFASYAFFFGAVSVHITWRQAFENQQRNMPEFAKRMMDQMTPEQKAAQEQRGPISTAITQALAPFGVLLIDIIGAGILLGTINFGFGGKATFSGLLVVELYAGMVIWPVKWLVGGLAAFFTDPETFNLQNPSPTNVAAFLSLQDTPKALYYFLLSIDAPAIWGMVLTAIGVAVVAKVSRASGYTAVFGWWAIGVLLGVAMGALFS